jgi:hypothetical protein
MDEFTIMRITRLVASFKENHGRDISEAELTADAKIAPSDVAYLVRKGVLDKYQVTTGRGSRENRFKMHRDWRTLKEPNK